MFQRLPNIIGVAVIVHIGFGVGCYVFGRRATLLQATLGIIWPTTAALREICALQLKSATGLCWSHRFFGTLLYLVNYQPLLLRLSDSLLSHIDNL